MGVRCVELRSEAKVTERVGRKSRPGISIDWEIIAMLGIAHKYMLGKESWSAIRPQKQV